MTDEYLMHWGRLGMKWGVRRYQNKDGTLTEAGKKRYARDIDENNAKKKDNRIIIDKPDANRWVKEDLKRTKTVLDNTNKVFNDAKNLDDAISDLTFKNVKVDLSSMSDAELRQAINRANLESQYMKILREEQANNVSAGRAYMRDFLEIGGSLITVGGSAVALALGIKELLG